MMKTPLSKNEVRGLTLFEVLVVVCIITLLAVIVFPIIAKREVRSSRLGCVYNLKLIGLAFRLWEGDNDNKYPMSVSVTNGGTMELIDRGIVWKHFGVMSKELNTPRILFCPQDRDPLRSQANTFGSSGGYPPGYIFPITGDTNVSYFIGVDATDLNPTMFLSGDRNLALRGIALKSGLHSLGTNDAVSWTAELHENQGNILMADGSVQSFSSKSLREALIKTGYATNRLAVP